MGLSRLSAFSGCLCLAVVLALAPVGLSDEPRKPDGAEPSQGEELYRMFCANCHGSRGHGDGPTAHVLNVVPANLTRLAKLNQGVFPAERIHKTIDGRDQVRGHGQRRMPIWGLAFQEYDRDTNQEAEVRSRIDNLVAYLRTIQE